MTTTAQKDLTIGSDLIDRLSDNLDEPEFVRELRRNALEQFQELPIPSAENNEEWRRTDVTDINFDEIQLGDGSDRSADVEPDELQRIREADTDRAAVRLEGNSTEVMNELDPELADQGVIVCSISKALREFPDKIEPYFLTEALDYELNKFSAFHAATWSGGSFVYVPEGVELDRPIELHNYVSEDGLSINDHTLVVAAPHSRVEIVETHNGDNSLQQRALNTSVVEIFADDGAEVDYSHIQNLPRNYYDLSMRRGVCQNNARINWIVGTLGSEKAKTSAITSLDGEGSESYLYGVLMATEGQHIDSDISTIHDAPYTTDEMLARGVVLEGGKGIFRGVIEMFNGSRKSKGSLHERALMVGDAEADAVPEMEITENDVKAAHSASVGELDEKQLLYMQSRGISRKTAKRMIIFGFFEPILERLHLERVKQDLIDLIDRKLDESELSNE